MLAQLFLNFFFHTYTHTHIYIYIYLQPINTMDDDDLAKRVSQLKKEKEVKET